MEHDKKHPDHLASHLSRSNNNKKMRGVRRAPVEYPFPLFRGLIGTAVAIIAVCMIVLTIFVGFEAFGDDDDGGSIHQRLIDSDGTYIINVTSFGACLEGAAPTLWRLQRTGNTVSGFLQGTCTNTSGVGTLLNIDFDLGALPKAFRMPSGDLSDPNVMGTGSALVGGANTASVVQIESNTQQDEVDMDIRFGGAVADGSDIEYSAVIEYTANN